MKERNEMHRLQLNSDGTSVKGSTIIHAPVGQAGEYAPLAVNLYRGCGNGCFYCYVPGVLRMPRTEFARGAVERPGFLRLLEKDARKYQALGITAQVMLSFIADPYHPGDTSLTRAVIQMLQAHGLGICTLTKGGKRALRDLDLFRPARDAFASTLTSLDDAFSRKWERHAALPRDRLRTLRGLPRRRDLHLGEPGAGARYRSHAGDHPPHPPLRRSVQGGPRQLPLPDQDHGLEEVHP
jgi:DNA repair photolyase